ncbi:MAG: HlyD family efflux transporter periplasmic adaptor subunit [Synechococcaceae bacterium WB9_3_282]|nr:HlyD family efflux transporter periplasmic adaptor subunit [Synechococcaceae bacterium WBA_3_309]NDE21877.1 HlyD family efflux transporter periplasmic adaptor subunit [Synechococcaceae bacterium WB9_3_282]
MSNSISPYSNMSYSIMPCKKPSNPKFFSTIACCLLATSAPLLLASCGLNKPEQVVAPALRQVSALGRLEPEGKIRKISLPSSLSGDRIEKLLVEENQIVKAGTPLAILNSALARKASLEEAQQEVKVAQSELALVRSGAKKGEIGAQEFKVQSLERQLAGETEALNAEVNSARSKQKEAKLEAERYESLFKAGGVSELQRDRYRTRADVANSDLAKAIGNRERTLSTLRSDIESSRNTLAQIKEIRPQDINKAQNQLDKALASLNRALQEYKDTTIRAPEDGQILKINARAGDKVGDEGLLEMADTSNMIVVAEVYQTDLPKISKGQLAKISVDGFNGTLKAQVFQLVPQVKRQSVFAGEPGENMDQRVFEVKLKLLVTPEQIEKIRLASNLQVNVIFDKSKPTNP